MSARGTTASPSGGAWPTSVMPTVPFQRTACLLAPAAAVGFVVLQIGATGVHLKGGDPRVALNITLMLAGP